MKRLFVFLSAIALLAQGPSAATKNDSLLALTSGARVKAVWVRWPWCSANYTPVQAYASVELEGDNPYTQLVVWDTDEGHERYIDSTIGSHAGVHITRKGTHVIWNDDVNKCSWIRDWAGTGAKTKLIDGGDYSVAACQWNSATNTEYIYTSGTGGTARIPLNADYTANTAQKTVLTTNRGQVSVSEDGKYLGGVNGINIFVVASGALLARRQAGLDAFGCQPNLSPDNSYRFFYLTDEHRMVRMYDQNLSETWWPVTINVGMPGNSTNHDCLAPRWSNNVRFFTNTYPLTSGYVQHWGSALIFGMSAAAVQAADPSNAGHFCLGKFSQDFQTVESYVLVSDGDIRHFDGPGEAWIAGSVDNTAPAAPAGLQGTADSESKVSLSWNAATDNESGILEYNLYRDGTRIAVLDTTVFVDSLLRESTDYVYTVSAVNGANMESAKSSGVTVRTTADTRKPTIAGVYALSGPTQVTVIFAEAVDKTTAETAANYQVTPGMTVSSSTLGGGDMIVVLTLSSALTAATQYTLTVNNVMDTAATPNTIAANTQKTFTFFPCGDDFNGASLDATKWTQVSSFTGTVSQTGGHLYIQANGQSNIGSGQFMAVRRSDITGDFDVWVKLINSNVAPAVSQQGIMIANNFSSLGQGGYATLGVEFYNGDATPINPESYVFRYGAPGSMTSAMSLQNVAYPCWLRLAKTGTTVTAFVSITGPYAWTEIGSASPPSIATNSQIGLYSSSPSAQAWGSHAFFDDFGCTIQGISAPPTQSVRRAIAPARSSRNPNVVVRNGVVEVMTPASSMTTVALINATGRTVARASGSGRLRCGIGREPVGVYVVRITSATGTSTVRALMR